MTRDARYSAAEMIKREIDDILLDRPNLTLTRDQLRNRIERYLDCPHTPEDARRIFCTLTMNASYKLPMRD
jgi:hypothetical protein